MSNLTPQETERLILLAEEASEVIQAAMKVLRYGWVSTHLACPGADNRSNLVKELGDLRGIAELMFQAKDLDTTDYRLYALDKISRVYDYLNCNENRFLASDVLEAQYKPGS